MSTKELLINEIEEVPDSLLPEVFDFVHFLKAKVVREKLEDLRIPPGNRLEKLAGNRQGQHSIRINDQWRICFRWSEGDAYEVEIVDYH